MKTICVTRKLDDLCRIVLPVDMRRAMALESQDEIEITLRGRVISVRKLYGRCPICKHTTKLHDQDGIYLCQSCLDTMVALVAQHEAVNPAKKRGRRSRTAQPEE